jgi:hypothetical protein
MENEGKEEIAKELELALIEVELSKTDDERQKALKKLLKLAYKFGEICTPEH